MYSGLNSGLYNGQFVGLNSNDNVLRNINTLLNSTNLTLWLRPDYLSGGPLTSWADSSFNRNNSVAGTAFTYDSTLGNGYGSALFNGTSDYVLFSTTQKFNFPGDFIVTVACKPTSVATQRQIIGNITHSNGGHLKRFK